MIKFQTHGIKTIKGLEPCSYSISSLINGQKCITIYGKNYRSFSAEIRAEFKVENNTEIMTDYFEDDAIRVFKDHPLFNDVARAARKQIEFRQKRSKHGDYYNARIDELNQLIA